ncbi:MAG: uroporphyrinogen-III C-methyltransferase, partial [Candidatus Dormibacteria bacterium]
ENADVVLHDALIDRRLLDLCAPATRLVDVGKRARRESTRQETINALLIAAAREGNFVVRLKGGDPMLFGRGGEEVNAVVRAGIPVRVIPGVSAALAAPAAAGIPVTHRGVAGSVAIITGRRAAGGLHRLEQIAAAVDTVIVLMPADVVEITERLGRVLGADRPAALISAATLPEQRVVRTTLGEIAGVAGAADAPRTLVVGDVVAAAVDLLGGVLPAEVLPAEDPA